MIEQERRFFPNLKAADLPDIFTQPEDTAYTRIEQAYLPGFTILQDRKHLMLRNDLKVRMPWAIPKGTRIDTLRVREATSMRHGRTFLRHYVTLKGPKDATGSGPEYEWPVSDTHPILLAANDSPLIIRKHRYTVPFTASGHHYTAEVDRFLPHARTGRPLPAWIIEVEGLSPDVEGLPAWLGQEITGRKRWSNYALARG